MENMHYIGLDVHKKTIAYCIKKVDGQIEDQGTEVPNSALEINFFIIHNL